MASEGNDVIAPRDLILPKREGYTALAASSVGTLFVSGGYLYMVSGATYIRFSGAQLAI